MFLKIWKNTKILIKFISSQNPEILKYQAFLDRYYGVNHCLYRPIKPIDISRIPEKNSTFFYFLSIWFLIPFIRRIETLLLSKK